MEIHDARPAYEVKEEEYLRLLGYPPAHQPGDRERELMAWARGWYRHHGRPWVCLREAPLRLEGEQLRIDGVEFRSRRLREHFHRHGVRRAMLVAVSAGPECEEHARQLWQEGRPDEYYFLEMFGSAVVEDLVARLSGRICALAAHQRLVAVPHYSPGYTGWDVAEQGMLFQLITSRLDRTLSGPLEVIASGMLRPKKSLLGVFGLAPADAGASVVNETPCVNCAFAPCQYRRAPYRHQVSAVRSAAVRPPEPGYVTPQRALRKWAAERVQVTPLPDGAIEAVFRFDGTTCSNLGRPLAFDYRVRLDAAQRIISCSCAPAPDDEGYRSTCAYLAEPERFLRDVAGDQPLLGRPLDDVLGWERPAVSTGCHCNADSRLHKWGFVLEAIHFALRHKAQAGALS